MASRPSQLLGHELHLLGQPLDLVADGPEQVLGHAPLHQRQVAGGEQVHRHVERLLGVVIGLPARCAAVRLLIGVAAGRAAAARRRRAVRCGMSFSPSPDTPSTLKTSAL